ncbi:hypothetical protein [Sinisalibacter lacisalsi]|uniref:Uncharacterized protein n=1 Tax=Sinisalibacter lacisalsi TaxID=1526570 RepID=A0ABQ1QN57_9RHOB|nr:hypothetical protein [Sinisalibacter lacisalsi]GGD34619.1 hypothetical protein GCM10011358_18340 [Sinisalibacter lacisalsi]
MQERYLGDSHDFLKYAVLKALHAGLGGPVGLNWYLTHPETVDPCGNGDGEKRHHLTQPVWRNCDPDLLAGMAAFSDPSGRTLARFEASDILPADTRYMSDPVPTDRDARADWHRRALDLLAPCTAVFLDPDNGFEVRSMTRKRSPKYALFEEVHAYRARGQAVVTIQFAPRRPLADVAREMLARHSTAFPEDRGLAMLRGRSAPNILLQLAAPPARQNALREALDALVHRLPGKLEWIAA